MKAQRLRKTAKLLRRRNCWVMLVRDHRNNSLHWSPEGNSLYNGPMNWPVYTTHSRNSGLLEQQSGGLQDPGVVIRVETGSGTLTCWFWGLNQQPFVHAAGFSNLWASTFSLCFSPFALSLTWVSYLCFNEFLLWNACNTRSSSSICNSLYYWTGFTSLFGSLLRLWKHHLCLYRVFSCCMEADRAQKKALLLGNV